MTIKTAILLLSILACAGAWAQQPPPPGSPGRPAGGGFMAEAFFPVELVMRHQQAIALTPEQQTAIRGEFQKANTEFSGLQWQLSAQEESLGSLVKESRPDSTKALEEFDKLLALENQIKRLHLALMLKIKSILTPEQQTQLEALKTKNPPRGERPPPPM